MSDQDDKDRERLLFKPGLLCGSIGFGSVSQICSVEMEKLIDHIRGALVCAIGVFSVHRGILFDDHALDPLVCVPFIASDAVKMEHERLVVGVVPCFLLCFQVDIGFCAEQTRLSRARWRIRLQVSRAAHVRSLAFPPREPEFQRRRFRLQMVLS